MPDDHGLGGLIHFARKVQTISTVTNTMNGAMHGVNNTVVTTGHTIGNILGFGHTVRGQEKQTETYDHGSAAQANNAHLNELKTEDKLNAYMAQRDGQQGGGVPLTGHEQKAVRKMGEYTDDYIAAQSELNRLANDGIDDNLQRKQIEKLNDRMAGDEKHFNNWKADLPNGVASNLTIASAADQVVNGAPDNGAPGGGAPGGAPGGHGGAGGNQGGGAGGNHIPPNLNHEQAAALLLDYIGQANSANSAHNDKDKHDRLIDAKAVIDQYFTGPDGKVFVDLGADQHHKFRSGSSGIIFSGGRTDAQGHASDYAHYVNATELLTQLTGSVSRTGVGTAIPSSEISAVVNAGTHDNGGSKVNTPTVEDSLKTLVAALADGNADGVKNALNALPKDGAGHVALDGQTVSVNKLDPNDATKTATYSVTFPTNVALSADDLQTFIKAQLAKEGLGQNVTPHQPVHTDPQPQKFELETVDKFNSHQATGSGDGKAAVPHNIDVHQVAELQDNLVKLGLMKQEAINGAGHGSFGPLTLGAMEALGFKPEEIKALDFKDGLPDAVKTKMEAYAAAHPTVAHQQPQVVDSRELVEPNPATAPVPAVKAAQDNLFATIVKDIDFGAQANALLPTPEAKINYLKSEDGLKKLETALHDKFGIEVDGNGKISVAEALAMEQKLAEGKPIAGIDANKAADLKKSLDAYLDAEGVKQDGSNKMLWHDAATGEDIALQSGGKKPVTTKVAQV